MIRAGVVFVTVAPLKGNGRDRGAAACRAAFEPEPECVSCSPTGIEAPKLPEFLPSIDG
jgi:hypothetical protein